MVYVQYWNGSEWISAGGPFGNETVALMTLGGDNYNYRTVDENGKVLTSYKEECCD